MTAGESNTSVCLFSLSCSQRRGKLYALIHTYTLHLSRTAWFWSFFASVLYIFYKPPSSSCPEEMVKFRTLGPPARLAWFQGAALLTCRWSLMDRKQRSKANKLSFLSHLFCRAPLRETRALQSLLITSVSQDKGVDMLMSSGCIIAKFRFYLGCLVVY